MSGDPMARLRSVDPARRVDLSRVDPGALRALREGVTMTVREPETAEAAAPSRHGLGRLGLGRRGTIAVGLSVVLAGGAVGFSAYQQFRSGADGVNCLRTWDSDDGRVDGPTLSGDPIADCAAYRDDAGLDPIADPVTFKYGGLVFVTPRDQVPPGVTPSAPDPYAAKVLELWMTGFDWVDGAMSACETPEVAAERARGDVARLGLTGWTVAIDETPMEPNGLDFPCAYTAVDTRAKTVTILPERGEEPQAETTSLGQLAAALRSGISESCVSIGDARSIADAALAAEDARYAEAYPGQSNVTPLRVWNVPDESAPCARVDMEVGGSIMIRVYGPTTAHPAG